MLQVTQIKPTEDLQSPEEVRLCLWCRRKGIEESLAARDRCTESDA